MSYEAWKEDFCATHDLHLGRLTGESELSAAVAGASWGPPLAVWRAFAARHGETLDLRERFFPGAREAGTARKEHERMLLDKLYKLLRAFDGARILPAALVSPRLYSRSPLTRSGELKSCLDRVGRHRTPLACRQRFSWRTP